MLGQIKLDRRVTMINSYIRRFYLIITHILIYFLIADSSYSEGSRPSTVPIGLLLDTNSPLGSMLHLCMQIALSDYYAEHLNSTTTLQLHTRKAESALEANLAALMLLEHEQVEAIIGSTQDTFISELGQKTQVPIISTTARSSSLSTEHSYVVRTTMDDSIQARALAAICQGFQWPQAVVLYEDTEYSRQFLSHLTNAFRDVGIGLVHLTAFPSSVDSKHLSKLLSPLKEQKTKVFIVHTSPSLGFRLFNFAKNVGMMREGSAWIITDSLSNFLSSMDSETRESMEGVIGVRPYVAPSKDLRNFQERWDRNRSRASMDLNVYGLWAYDTIKALAIAVENIGPVTQNSSYGSQLLRELRITRFRGLSGNFQLVDGRLKASDMEIMNLIGTGEKTIGFWNPHRGITRDHLSSIYRNSRKEEVKNVVWPGDSTIIPKGWAIPPSGILRVGVPWKPGFKQFVDAVVDPVTNETCATGFAIDMFLHALKQMPFPINYTFYCYNESLSTNWSYDSMLHEIPEKYDMVVADTTIWAPRASYVDFSLPYMESELVLVLKNNRPLDMWIFIKPLSWDLWLAIVVASLVMGLFMWRLEHQPAPPAALALAAAALAPAPIVDAAPALALAPIPAPAPAPVVAAGPAPAERQENIQDDRLRFAFLVPIAALAFPEAALVGRKTSLFLLVCWLFSAFILMQSYTANFSAILTIDALPQFSFTDEHYIGYHEGSFAKEFLTETLHVSATRLRPYSSVEEYHDAMCKGSKRGGIDAIFDERPYMKLLLNRYYSRYVIKGPTFRTDGLGFALPIGSPLVAHFSRAILNVTQGPYMIGLEQKNFGPGYSSQDPLSNTLSQGTSSLTFRDFIGLFIILGGLAIFAFVSAQMDLYNKMERKITDLSNRFRNYRNGRVGNVAAAAANGDELVAAAVDDGARGDRNRLNGDDADADADDGARGDGNRVKGDDADADVDVDAASGRGGDLNEVNEDEETEREQNRDGNDHHLPLQQAQ